MPLLGSSKAAAQTPRPGGITVAAAANLSDVFKDMAARFTRQTGIPVKLNFGATQQLTQQIENGAPFDVFASADTAHVDSLDQQGLLLPQSKQIYARGFLVLWCPSTPAIKTLADLRTAPIRYLAVAKPEAAPYGKGAVQALEKSGLWSNVASKIVYAENITLARQYVSSGNAECGFLAKSLLRGETRGVIAVDPQLYTPILQSLAVVKSSAQAASAQRFAAFVLSSQGREILSAWGYGPPAP